jgi:hypothetical protein
VQHQLSQQLTGPSGGEPDQHAGGLRTVLARLDHAHQIIRDSQPFERCPSPAPDLGIRIVQSNQQRPHGRGADLLQRLDTPHPNPPGRIPECPHQPINDLGPAELAQRTGNADPDEWSRVDQEMFQQMIDGARVAQPAESRSCLAAYLFIGVAEPANQSWKCALSSHLTEDVSCPRSRRIAGRAGEQSH